MFHACFMSMPGAKWEIQETATWIELPGQVSFFSCSVHFLGGFGWKTKEHDLVASPSILRRQVDMLANETRRHFTKQRQKVKLCRTTGQANSLGNGEQPRLQEVNGRSPWVFRAQPKCKNRVRVELPHL